MTERRRGRGAGLDREKVLEAALALANGDGLDAVSFRRLGARLGVTPMALYRYVRDKDELLDGIADLVLAELELPDEGGDWRTALRAIARSFRSVLAAHPAVLPIVTSRPLFTPAGLRAANAALGVFRGAGFELGQAVLLYAQFVRLVLALVSLEAGSGKALGDDERRARAARTRLLLETLPADVYPHLVAAAPLTEPYDPDRAFEAGLDLLIAGIEHARTVSPVTDA
jgi:AcrR family transcriptional regulator